ncbi:MAG: amidohydrolase [Lachnospiraceae bacterium]|nr:amidohydrolase [Lachnospiraceae bacterium]
MDIKIKNIQTLIRKEEGFVMENHDIYISGNKIVSLDQAPENFVAEKEINGTDKLAMPGIINAHTHAYMSFFRNYADDMLFWDWLNKVQTAENYITEEDCYWGTLLNNIEMIKTGTTCYVDMYIKSSRGGALGGPESACAGAAYKMGMRAVLTRGMDGPVGNPHTEDQINEFLAEKEAFKDVSTLKFWFGPHAPYSCPADNLVRIAELVKEYGVGQTIHLAESDNEVENCMAEHGCSPIKYVADLGVLDVPTIAAHCVKVSDEDIQILKEHNVSVALNPKSNMKLGNGFMPAEKFLEAGVNCCIGTDSCGSNNSQNMFSEMNMAALIYKGDMQKAQCISAQDVLRYVTVNGAKAIGMEGQLGEIKEGMLADISILNLYEPEFFPSCNIVSGLVYSATGREVETVIIDGEIIMENNEILTVEEGRVYYEVEKIADRLGMLKL